MIDPYWCYENSKEAANLIEQLQEENEELKALISSDMRDTVGKLLALQEENAGLKAKHAKAMRQVREGVNEYNEQMEEAAQREIDELKATVNALRDAILKSEEGGGVWIGDDWVMSEAAADKLDEVVNKTPAQHLAEHDARVVEKIAESAQEYFNEEGGYFEDAIDLAKQYAQHLRDQAND